MEWNQIEGQWDSLKGKVKEKWGKLTDDDLMQIKGKKDGLVGQLKKKYGLQKEDAEKQIDEFKISLDQKKKNKDTKDTKDTKVQ